MSELSGFQLLYSSSNKPVKKPDTDSSDNVVRATDNFKKYIEFKIEEESKKREQAQKEIKEASK